MDMHTIMVNLGSGCSRRMQTQAGQTSVSAARESLTQWPIDS